MTQEQKSFFKKEISVGEVIGLMVALAGVFFTFYVTTTTQLSNHDLRLQLLEKEKDVIKLEKNEAKAEQKEAINEQKTAISKIDAKLDVITTSLNDLKVQIQNKQDKE